MMKRGSALLIVLGMVAFMTISAIAFAAFMRSARQPSSYLRRTSTSRLLAKTALAEAIDEIDIAIGNDLYPGMGDRGYPYLGSRTTSTTTSPDTRRRNYWRKGCFIGSNNFEKVENTVSTLTLEGLAYLPPYMINEARYYSRHATTARWKSLPFDAGRYAFSAFDVSDCLDINRVAANVGRNSSDDGRISLAYLFENVTHDAYDTACKPQDWEDFMDSYVDAVKARDNGFTGRMPWSDGKMPLVSLADYSLAAKENLTTYPNPFCSYIENGASFVSSSGGIQGQRLRNQMFVTDSYLPKSPVEEKAYPDVYDLNNADCQPFPTANLAAPADIPIRTATDAGSKAASRLRNKGWLCDVGLAALWDYLDCDRVPISLAVPTTERVPMICGIEVKTGAGTDVKMKLSVSKEAPVAASFVEVDDKTYADSPVTVLSYDDTQDKNTALARTVSQKALYKLDAKMFGAFFNGLDVNVLTVYPFRRIDNDRTYTIGGCLAFYFSEQTAKSLHTETDSDILHLGSDAQKNAIRNGKPTFSSQLGVFYMPLKEKALTVKTGIEKEQDAVAGCQLDPNAAEDVAQAFAQTVNDNEMFSITRSWQQTRTYNSNTGTYTSWTPKDPPTSGSGKATVVAAECKIPPLTKAYSTDGNYTKSQSFMQMVDSGKNAMDVIPQLSVWVYVKDRDGKYVDLVPACVKDDDDLNQIDNYEIWGPDANAFGMPYPLMNFYGTQFAYNPGVMTADQSDFMTKGVDFGIDASSVLFCPDPRWNWAPEQWIKASGAALNATSWLANSRRGESGRDRDIFMETSDAGYLQSVYELAFVPRLTETNPIKCNDPAWGNMTALDGVAHKDFATHFEKTGNDDRNYVVNNEFMWRTYRPFEQRNADGSVVTAEADLFEDLGFTSIGTGYRVSPYASTNALMAAFANTPFSWAVASTNTLVSNQGLLNMTASERKAEHFNENYAFSAFNQVDDTTFRWDDLCKIADNLYVGVHEKDFSGRSLIKSDSEAIDMIDTWKDVFDGFNWAGTKFGYGSRIFAGVALNEGLDTQNAQAAQVKTCDLTDADKKFLYGYWRECFAPRQQLFLVFVRAEPVLMGGGSAASAPPQLGARAVALVWRDPMPTIEDVSGGQPRPHRTRILFYRQFE